MYVCLDDIERSRIFVILFDVFLGYLRRCDSFFFSSVDDLVINVSEVLYELDFIASVFEISPESIENYERSGISNVEEIVDRRSAHIHPDLALFDRYEFFLAVGQGIVD